jgi:hypothetical protein
MADDRAPLTVDELPGLSAAARRALKRVLTLPASAEAQAEATEEALELLKRDLDGQPAEALEGVLDLLREEGAYGLSLELLEEAWSAELPLDLLGRVAQDWVGTVLFGLGDREGARTVARHLRPRAVELGASFCSDLCDLYLEWGLADEARPLAEEVVRAQPGDASARFHLGVCAKLSGEWGLARECFDEVLLHSTDPATRWNRALVAVAERDWAVARAQWSALGLALPPGEGDYAAIGELTPVRLNGEGGAPDEVLWGARVCPARVLLTGLPYHHRRFRCGDTLLVDGVKAGEVEHNGARHTVVPALGVWEASTGRTVRLVGPPASPVVLGALDAATRALGARGWAVAHWTRAFPRLAPAGSRAGEGAPLTQLCVYVPADRSASELWADLCAHLSGAVELYAEGGEGALAAEAGWWASEIGEAPEAHVAGLMGLLGAL